MWSCVKSQDCIQLNGPHWPLKLVDLGGHGTRACLLAIHGLQSDDADMYLKVDPAPVTTPSCQFDRYVIIVHVSYKNTI